MENWLHNLSEYLASCRPIDSGYSTSPTVSERLWQLSSTLLTITMFTGMNWTQWASKIALLLEQKQMSGLIQEYNDLQQEPAAKVAATEKPAFKDWMNHDCVATPPVILNVEHWIPMEYTVVDDAITPWEILTSACRSELNLTMFEIRGDIWISTCRTVEISRTIHFESITQSRISKSVQRHWPLMVILLI